MYSIVSAAEYNRLKMAGKEIPFNHEHDESCTPRTKVPPFQHCYTIGTLSDGTHVKLVPRNRMGGKERIDNVSDQDAKRFDVGGYQHNV